MSEGIKTVIYPVSDLARAKTAFGAVLGASQAMDEPYYVQFNVNGPTGFTYEIFASADFLNWLSLTNLAPTSTQFQFIDRSATNWSQRFYRGSAH